MRWPNRITLGILALVCVFLCFTYINSVIRYREIAAENGLQIQDCSQTPEKDDLLAQAARDACNAPIEKVEFPALTALAENIAYFSVLFVLPLWLIMHIIDFMLGRPKSRTTK